MNECETTRIQKQMNKELSYPYNGYMHYIQYRYSVNLVMVTCQW